jgi:hypothetical protein
VLGALSPTHAPSLSPVLVVVADAHPAGGGGLPVALATVIVAVLGALSPTHSPSLWRCWARCRPRTRRRSRPRWWCSLRPTPLAELIARGLFHGHRGGSGRAVAHARAVAPARAGGAR